MTLYFINFFINFFHFIYLFVCGEYYKKTNKKKPQKNMQVKDMRVNKNNMYA